MRISLSVWDMPARTMVQMATTAEAAGFHGLWVGEHVLAPVAYDSSHPTTGASAHQHHADAPIIALDTELVDPLVALAGVAAATHSLQLATGVFVLPLRHPLQVARSAMTLQDLADGRFRLGIGAGWLREEFAALGQSFAGRGARLEEDLEILAKACAGGPFEHDGDHYHIDRVQLTPRPVDVPIVFGGNSPRALLRAARMATGWFASGTPDVSEVAPLRDEILRLREDTGVEAPIATAVRCPSPNRDLIDQYARAGFDEVVLWADQVWVGDTLQERNRALMTTAHQLGLGPGAAA